MGRGVPGVGLALPGADRARRNRLLQSEWAANGKNPVADLHAVRISQLGCRKTFAGVDFYYGKIGFLVGADHFGVMQGSGSIVLQFDAYAICLFDHVAVGQDISLGINDHARTERALADRALITAALSAEETIEEIIERIVIITAPTAVRRIGRRTPPAYCRLNRGYLQRLVPIVC